jgi:outer membrane protein OmpA-like peptidoglycan-associated protein
VRAARAARTLLILTIGSGSLAVGSRALAKDALKIDLVPKAQKGQGLPEIIVHAEAPLKHLVLDVRRSTDKKRIKLEAGPVGGGREHRFPLEMKSTGSAVFEGKLSVELDNGDTGEMPIQVSAELLEPLVVAVKPEDVDLKARQLVLSANRELKKVEVSVMSDTGTPLGTTAGDADGPSGGPYRAGWKQSKGTVLRISIKASDADGFFGGVDLFPWKVDIPHQEVNFRTGSFDIDPPESPKLDESYKLIEQAINKYGKLATIRLFIAGHTDTVGDKASNLTLSNNRARTLGRWFRKRGIKIPILFAGFGEEMLAVETPDETEEVRNRRAEYIVAVDPPPMKGPGRFVPLE